MSPTGPTRVTHVATTDAATADLDTVQGRHRDLAGRDLLPEVHLVDAGYVSVGQILSAADDHGVQLTGPLPPDTSWQAMVVGRSKDLPDADIARVDQVDIGQ